MNIRQGDSRLSKRIMFGRLAVQGPKRGGRPATSRGDSLQKNLEAFGAIPREGNDGRKWMTAAKNACGTGGSRMQRKHLRTPGDARTPASPTRGASARLVD